MKHLTLHDPGPIPDFLLRPIDPTAPDGYIVRQAKRSMLRQGYVFKPPMVSAKLQALLDDL